jgi:hypothetical protein
LKIFSFRGMIISDHSVVETVLEARDENERMQVGVAKECVSIYIYTWNQGSIVDRGRSSSPGRVKNFLQIIQTGSGVHPNSYPMGTGGSFPRVKAAGA